MSHRPCTECDSGLLYAPVRFCQTCGGIGIVEIQGSKSWIHAMKMAMDYSRIYNTRFKVIGLRFEFLDSEGRPYHEWAYTWKPVHLWRPAS